MLLELNIVLPLIFLTCENFSFSKASSYFLTAENHPPSIDVIASKSNQGDHLLSRSLKTIENVLACSSGSWNSSSNCTELLRTYFGRKFIDINKENKIPLPKKESVSIEVLLANTKNASLYDPPVNSPTTAKNIHLKPIKTDLVDESRKKRQISPSGFTNKSPIGLDRIRTTKKSPSGTIVRTTKKSPSGKTVRSTKKSPSGKIVRTTKKSAKTTKIGSIQSVLKKIFPEDFFTMKPTSGKRNRKPPDFTRNSSEKRKKVTKPVARRFGKDSLYFRAGDANNQETNTTNNSTEASLTEQNENNSATNQTEPQLNTTAAAETQTEIITEKSEPGAEQTGPELPGPEQPENGTDAENPEDISTSVSQNVKYHYHFHYFGGVVPPTSPTAD